MKTAQRATILQRLEGLHQKGLHRSLEPFSAAGARLPGNALNFCANDYLNLAQHPKVQEQAIYAIRHYGCSSASSRLLSGHLELHQQLEERLAAWSGYEAALCFGSGYLANCGILQAVLEPGAFVLFDRLNHASLIDGLRLAIASQTPQASQTSQVSRAQIGAQIKWQRYRHCDMSDLKRRLQAIRTLQSERTIWIISESVFSMDGDIAPLCEITRLAEQYGCHWLVDEAHAAGIYGPNGAGLTENLATRLKNTPGRLPDFVTANFAKALGSYGGYCLCSAEWRDYLVNFCRSFTYSTALPPASAAAALAAIELVQAHCADPHQNSTKNSENANYRAAGLGYQLLERSAYFRNEVQCKLQNLLPDNFPLAGNTPVYSPIVPLILGQNETALKLAQRLRKHDVVVKAIRSPTVPAGTARLRFSLGLAHSESDLEHCASALQAALQEEG